jgi:hypothetical protein
MQCTFGPFVIKNENFEASKLLFLFLFEHHFGTTVCKSGSVSPKSTRIQNKAKNDYKGVSRRLSRLTLMTREIEV